MKSSYFKKISILFVILAALVLAFNNCSGQFEVEGISEDSSESTGNCPLAEVSLRSPQNIEQVVSLINALPKPLTLPCFIENLSRPLGISAVDSTFSAQPSDGPDSPRIFIVRGQLLLSVAPTGLGKQLLELGEVLSGTESVKAEIPFPVLDVISSSLPFDYVRLDFGTNCNFCHIGERQVSGYPSIAYASTIMRPDPFKKVTAERLRFLASTCGSDSDLYRCQILKAVAITGQAQDVAFP